MPCSVMMVEGVYMMWVEDLELHWSLGERNCLGSLCLQHLTPWLEDQRVAVLAGFVDNGRPPARDLVGEEDGGLCR